MPGQGEAAIIGAGYAGLVLAWKLAEAGVRVDVYEEHGEDWIGRPRHCTGLVSSRVVEGLDAWSLVVDKYKTVEFKAGGETLALRPRGGVYRLDRVGLERLLYGRASDVGARFHLETRVDKVDPERGVLYAGGASKSYRLIVVATGSLGSLRGLWKYKTPRRLAGWNMVYSKGVAPPEGTIRVDFTPGLSTGFFAWIMRVGSGILAGSAAEPGDVARVRVRLEEEYRLEDRIDAYGGIVLAGPPVEPLYHGRVVLAGDAGGLVKPLTGGGLYPGLSVALDASASVNRGVNIVEAVRSAVARTASRLRRQFIVARLLHSDPRLVEEGIRYARSVGLHERLSNVIDYDMHEQAGLTIASRLRPRDIAGLLSRPRLLMAGLRMAAAGLGSRLLS